MTFREISGTTRAFLSKVVDALRGGFTGKIEIDCNDGGIRSITFSNRITSKDLGEDLEKNNV